MQVLAGELEALQAHLNDGLPAISFTKGDSEGFKQAMRELGLLTAKKVIYCANVDEAHIAGADDNAYVTALKEFAAQRGANVVIICAKIEAELQGLDDAEQAEILDSYGVTESSLESVIRSGYQTLGLVSYFTAGEKEVRAWTIPVGCKAPQAAGVIHTDFEKGFIAAQVVNYNDLISAGSEQSAKASGKIRTEGKDYIMQPDDVVEFRFNV